METELVTPDVSISELEQRWGISRNALKARARALGTELIRKGPTLTVWPGERLAEAERLHEHLRQGGSMASFGTSMAVTPHGVSDGSKPAVIGKGSDLAALAAAVAAAMPQPPAPAVDPLDRARRLAEAAELSVALSNAELASLLGVAPTTVSSWADGHSPRPGFVLHREKVGQNVWWVVDRVTAGSARQLPAVTANGRRVGFASADVVEARVSVFGMGTALFAQNMIGPGDL